MYQGRQLVDLQRRGQPLSRVGVATGRDTAMTKVVAAEAGGAR